MEGPTSIPTVTIEKPSLPTLWLDTSVAIKLTKIKKGEALQQIEAERCTRLRDLVFRLVREGKLLCPVADQEEEYAGERLDEEISSMFATLSLGISLTHRQAILDSQIFKGMTAFANKEESIFLPASIHFRGDPIRRLQQAIREPYIVSIGPWKSPEILKRRAQSKENIGQQWEQLRLELRAKGQTFERQLAVEQLGELTAMRTLVQKFFDNLLSGKHDFWDFMGAQGPLLYRYYWNEIKGQPPDWEGVLSFFSSPYFFELPQPFATTRLVAELLTGNEPIEPSDPIDVEFLSIALSVAHYVLADRRMEIRIKNLGLDKKCGAEVYSMSTINGLFRRLEAI